MTDNVPALIQQVEREYTVYEWYLALTQVECTYTDPWVRTKVRPYKDASGKWVGSSTAFGPAQITGRMVRDFYDRYPARFTCIVDFIDRYLQQAELFKLHGMMEGTPGYLSNYDYGGSGWGFNGDDKEMYEVMAYILIKIVIEEVLQEVGNDPKDIAIGVIRRWRGLPYGPSTAVYYDAVLDNLVCML